MCGIIGNFLVSASNLFDHKLCRFWKSPLYIHEKIRLKTQLMSYYYYRKLWLFTPLESWGFPKMSGQHIDNRCCIVFHPWRTFRLFVKICIEWLNYISGIELGKLYSLMCSVIKNKWLFAKGSLLILLPQGNILTNTTMWKSELMQTNQSLKKSRISLNIQWQKQLLYF